MQPRTAILSQAHIGLGGAETNVLQLVEQLGDAYDFRIIAPMKPVFRRAAASIIPENHLLEVKRFSKFSAVGVAHLAKLFRTLGVSIVHTQDARSRLLGHPAARLVGAAAVHTYHMSPLFYDTSGIRQAFDRGVESLFNRRVSHHSIFVSENVLRFYERQDLVDRSKASVVHNGIDPAPYDIGDNERAGVRRNLRDGLGLDKDAVVACSVGRLTSQKGIDYLIRAVGNVSEQNDGSDGKNARFAVVVAGDGQMRDELEAMVRSFGVQDSIRFLGALEADEVRRLMLGSDVFILPSRFECFPYTILEAMAARLPCVVSDVGGNAEMVQDGRNGYVFPTGDVESLTASLQRLLDDSAQRTAFGKEGRRVVERFSLERMAQSTRRVYEDVLDDAR